ncbi:unnamed protein product [Lota lota]
MCWPGRREGEGWKESGRKETLQADADTGPVSGAEGGATPQAQEARSLARCTRAWHRREQRWARETRGPRPLTRKTVSGWFLDNPLALRLTDLEWNGAGHYYLN